MGGRGGRRDAAREHILDIGPGSSLWFFINPQSSLITCIEEMLVLCESTTVPLRANPMIHLPSPSCSVAHYPASLNLQHLLIPGLPQSALIFPFHLNS